MVEVTPHDFFQLLWHDKPEKQYILLWTLYDSRSHWFQDLAAAGQFAASVGGHDVYMGVGLSGQDYGPYRRCASDEISCLAGIGADLDIKSVAHPTKPLPLTIVDALSILPPMMPPSLVIETGNGVQVWWLFKEVLVIESEEERKNVARALTRWHTMIGARYQAHGWAYEKLADLARILRIPGTKNHKDPANPKPVVLRSMSDARYNMADFDSFLDDAGVGDPELQERAGTEWRDRFKEVALKVDLNARFPQDIIDGWCTLDMRFQNTWKGQRHDLKDQSTSGYDMALTHFGVSSGLSPQQIIDLIVTFRAFHELKPRRRLEYYQRNIAKALAWHEKHGVSSDAQPAANPTQSADGPPPPLGENKNHSASSGEETTGQSSTESGPSTDPGASGERPSEADTGKENAPGAAFLIAQVEASKNVNLVYQHIGRLAELSEADLAITYQRLKTALGSKLDRGHFERAIKEARTKIREKTPKLQIIGGAPNHPYRINGGRIIRLKPTKDGNDEVVALTNFIAIIHADIGEDDGVEVKRFFGIEANLAGKPYNFIVPAARFAVMDWPIEHIGPGAIVHPNQKDWARAAIQSLSTGVREDRIYVHTGWQKVSGTQVYLHGGGAIGPSGVVPNVDVRLSGVLAHYELLLPENRDQLIEAVRGSLRVLDLAPDHIVYPVLAGVYRAAIKPSDFAIWLSGPTGVFKSELAALAQQHYGPLMNARRLPGNFASTGNSLEVLAFAAKDSLLVIDDFAPHGATHDIARYYASTDRILRAAGNSQGRSRLSSDARLREAKSPRGLILATGEDVPRGQSIRGRILIVEVAPGDVKTDILTECQAAAAQGLYARAMGDFVQWWAAQYEELQVKFQNRVLELRSQATKVHSRTPGIVSDLHAGFEFFLEFAVSTSAITTSDQQALTERCWTALNDVAAAQRIQQDASEPTHRFLELLRSAILSGPAHVAGINGGAPGSDGEWGWLMVGSGDHQRLVSRGKCVGWVDGSSLYLEPAASFGVAQELGRTIGEPLVVSEATLRKRLKEKGLLASTDVPRGTLTVRHHLRQSHPRASSP